MHNTFIKSRRRPTSRSQPAKLAERFPIGADGRVHVSWAQASPALRDAHNRLRVMRGLDPIPEPEIDLYKPAAPPPTNLDALRIVHGDHLFWEELLATTASLLSAHAGDVAMLKKRRQEGTATLEEYQLAVDLLSPSKIVRDAHRPKEWRLVELIDWCLTEWVKAGKPEIRDDEDRPIHILDALQKHFGRKGLSRTVVLDAIARIKGPAAGGMTISGSTPVVALTKKRSKK